MLIEKMSIADNRYGVCKVDNEEPRRYYETCCFLARMANSCNLRRQRHGSRQIERKIEVLHYK